MTRDFVRRHPINPADKFGRLTVVEFIPGVDGSRAKYLCVCECGRESKVAGYSLRSGDTRSCGCLVAEAMRAAITTHGQTGTPTHRAWKAMRVRCTNPRQSHWARYGGRGIKVCERWDDFANFLADMGEKPPGMTLDRIDNDGDYTPENCRWATQTEQVRNSTKVRLNVDSVRDIRAALARKESSRALATQYGVSRSTINNLRYPKYWL